MIGLPLSRDSRGRRARGGWASTRSASFVREAAAVAGVHFRPGAFFERFAGGFYGPVDVLGGSAGDVGDFLFGGGVVGREGFAVEGVDPFAADEHFGLADFGAGDFGGFGAVDTDMGATSRELSVSACAVVTFVRSTTRDEREWGEPWSFHCNRMVRSRWCGGERADTGWKSTGVQGHPGGKCRGATPLPPEGLAVERCLKAPCPNADTVPYAPSPTRGDCKASGLV